MREDIHDALKEIIRETERLMYQSDGRANAQAFPFLCILADAGYIPSFLWIAECYYEGVGCERNFEKAKKYFFEALLFADNHLAKQMLINMLPEALEQDNDCPQNPLLRNILSEDPRKEHCARVRIAWLIREGRIRDYASETAYVLLKQEHYDSYWNDDGMALYLLGKCVLDEIDLQHNVRIADNLFWYAELELDSTLEYFVHESGQRYKEETLFTEDEYRMALEDTHRLQKQLEEKILYMDTQESDAFPNSDFYFEEWEKEVHRYIKRAV